VSGETRRLLSLGYNTGTTDFFLLLGRRHRSSS